jgi:hypothetical protein
MKYGSRIIAIFLVFGGLLGLLSLVMMRAHLAEQHQSLPVLASALSIALFAWGILTGVALWRATPRGLTWAKILLALQVPVFHVGRLTYEFSTGFSFRVMIGSTNRYIGGDIGSSLNFWLSPESLGFMFGINIVAVVALGYLIGASRSAPTDPHELCAATGTRWPQRRVPSEGTYDKQLGTAESGPREIRCSSSVSAKT